MDKVLNAWLKAKNMKSTKRPPTTVSDDEYGIITNKTILFSIGHLAADLAVQDKGVGPGLTKAEKADFLQVIGNLKNVVWARMYERKVVRIPPRGHPDRDTKKP